MLFEKIKFRCLEIHVSHACNLKCVSCAHFSDQGHRGFTTLDDLEFWLVSWSKKIFPIEINLLGGEPTLNKNLIDFIYSTRKNWKKSKINLVTNGFFLHKHDNLPVALEETNCNLIISIHDNSQEYEKKINEIKKLIYKWKNNNKFNVEWRESFKNWKLLFKGKGSDMLPFEDNNPQQSWRNCESKHTKQLYLNKIWKCPPLAYLKMQNDKYKMNKVWEKYLNYEPADNSFSFSKLKRFLQLKDEFYCSMCPANPEKIKKPNPMK